MFHSQATVKGLATQQKLAPYNTGSTIKYEPAQRRIDTKPLNHKCRHNFVVYTLTVGGRTFSICDCPTCIKDGVQYTRVRDLTSLYKR